jgi:uncharacterized Zn-finger protein
MNYENLGLAQQSRRTSSTSVSITPGGQPRMTEWQCQFCSKTFAKNSNYIVHVRSHTGERPFVCIHPGCEKDFAVRSNLNRHMKTTHQIVVDGGDDDESAEAQFGGAVE